MDQETLELTVQAARFAGYDMVAAMALFAYDYLLMLPKEQQYVWGAKWTPGKVMYLLVRYLPFFDLPLWVFDQGFMGQLPMDCATATLVTTIPEFIAAGVADIVFGLRTWALWNRGTVMGCIIIGGYILFNGASVTVISATPSGLTWRKRQAQNLMMVLFRDAHFAGYEMAAAMTLFAYDYLLMIQKERRYIWAAKLTPGKVMYLLVRYLPFLYLPLCVFEEGIMGDLPLDCAKATLALTIPELLAAAIADVVYGLRSWAVWGRGFPMVCLIIVAYILFNGAAVVIVSIDQSALTSVRIQGLSGCFTPPLHSNSFWVAYLLNTTFQLLLLILTLLRGLHFWRRQTGNLTTVLFRDAFLAFLAQWSVGIAAVIMLVTLVWSPFSGLDREVTRFP
ncbi:hypothetical protein DACRYDRAFT_112399 [Dacryopinax primogenitus]|uniref:DUF6533 domain-containing protein n=1 Tax=Dacryopinax primogenitus (strain DJM 731) TaxID=1858805 RepID=M5FU70_DACPD|nr:uncharacterized protein DACRYDRAFT_112399 [Dacryopinax primogenitus]EJT96776.1 hypothetical protein DACRYDRAFT_112399 [Dacryopinax primogenitus]